MLAPPNSNLCVAIPSPKNKIEERDTDFVWGEGRVYTGYKLVKISFSRFREVYVEKSITRLTCHFPRPFFPSLSGLHQLPPCINVPNKIKIVSGAIREVKHCLYGNRETAGCRVKFYPACSFLMNVKARPATKEKRVFRKRDPWKFGHLFSAFWCQHFTMVCCEQWKRTIPSCKYAYVTNPLIIFFYIINPAIKTFLHKNLFIF